MRHLCNLYAYLTACAESVARCLKRGYDMNLLKEVVTLLLTGSPLPEKCKPHKLSGNFAKHWECHINAFFLHPKPQVF
ncbi:MAG: type II toxin-antitoxin system YafQ family toxin [Prevotellaceae bacterium]|nr:type II toxin-antitoxin system YafQ family toxin [Prevotellaceae bacterium]